MSEAGTSRSSESNQEAQSRFYHEVFDFQVDVNRRLVTVKFGTRVSADEIFAYASELRSHPEFQPTFSEIVDLRETEELDLQANDFLRLADNIDPFSAHAKRAFVVRTRVQNHAARMHKVLRPHNEIAIFESVEDAETWIGSQPQLL